MLATIWDTHVKDMGWAICGSSSQSPTREVTSDMKFTDRKGFWRKPVQGLHNWCYMIIFSNASDKQAQFIMCWYLEICILGSPISVLLQKANFKEISEWAGIHKASGESYCQMWLNLYSWKFAALQVVAICSDSDRSLSSSTLRFVAVWLDVMVSEPILMVLILWAL